MRYSVQIKQSALKELKQLSKADKDRIISAIDQLSDTPLVGKLLKGNLSGLRRLRIGDYRIIYEIKEGEVTVPVLQVSHRKQVYR